MKYCTACGSEYQDDVEVCADDGNTELVSANEMRARGLPMVEERDTREFVRSGTAEDPLSAERLTALLAEHGIAVFARPRHAGTVDVVTSGIVLPWWELLVPKEQVEKAAGLIEQGKRELEALADEASLAAEEEERETGGEP